MNELKRSELGLVTAGCAEHCWGDFSLAGFGASVVAGAIGGMRGGWASAAIGGLAGGLGYAGSKVGDTMSKRTTDETDE